MSEQESNVKDVEVNSLVIKRKIIDITCRDTLLGIQQIGALPLPMVESLIFARLVKKFNILREEYNIVKKDALNKYGGKWNENGSAEFEDGKEKEQKTFEEELEEFLSGDELFEGFIGKIIIVWKDKYNITPACVVGVMDFVEFVEDKKNKKKK